MLCEKCNNKIYWRIQGTTQGWICPACGWGILTTYIGEIDADETGYSLYIRNVDGIDFRGQEVVTELGKEKCMTRYIRGYDLIASGADSARTYYHYASDELGSITHVTGREADRIVREILSMCDDTTKIEGKLTIYRKGKDKMIRKYEILDLIVSKTKINEPVTKFGGYPNFLYEQQWPTSEGWEDRKMMFLGQIVIEKGMLGNKKGVIAYIFVTHPTSYNDDFYDPDVTEWDGGESKVIIQNFDDLSGVKTYSPEGPTIFNERDERYEYIPILKEGIDANYLTNEEFRELTSEQQKRYFYNNDKNKIGASCIIQI